MNIYQLNPFWTGNYSENVHFSWPTHYYKKLENISSKFSSNSESFASELLENLEEMLFW